MNRNHPAKITIVGAGSSSFSSLLGELVACRELDGARLSLVDPDTDALDVMERLGRRMARQWGRKTRVSAYDERRKALADADFVITLVAVGGTKTWRQDQEIPERYGYQGHACDSTGPGGLFRGLRLIPPLIDVCRDVEEVCPRALVINYSNPMTAVCRALRKTTRARVYGLCTAGHLPTQVARFLEINPSRVDVISGGLNHCVWALKISVDGTDATERFHEEIRKRQGTGYYRSSVELLDLFGVWPMPGSGHVAEFFPYFYGDDPDGRAVGRYSFRDEGSGWAARVRRDRERREKLRAQADGREPLGGPSEESAGEAVRMIVSVRGNRPGRFYVNVPNRGVVPNLPDEAIVEVPVMVDATSVRAMHVGPLPTPIVGFMQARWAYCELVADSAIQRSRRVALQALMADVNTTSIPRARKCFDAMFRAQKEYLPGFKP